MAAIHEVQLSATGTSGVDKSAVAAALWKWLRQHKDDKVYTINFWIIRKTLTFGDLFPVFTLILGPDVSVGGI